MVAGMPRVCFPGWQIPHHFFSQRLTGNRRRRWRLSRKLLDHAATAGQNWAIKLN